MSAEKAISMAQINGSLSEKPEKKDEEWTEIISPRTHLFDLPLRQLWNYRDLMWLFVRRDFVAQYKQTVLGPLWHLIQPIFTTIVFLLVFGKIANIPTDGIEPRMLFYMSGITVWNYFSGCLTSTSTVFLTNAAIFGKVYFPRLVLPLSIIISNIVRFGIQFLLLLALMIWFNFQGYPMKISFHWLYIPLIIALMAGIGLGLGIIISALTTRYRDLAVLLTFVIQLAMYATPVAYPLSYLRGKPYRWLIEINPLTSLVECFRYALFGKGTFDMQSLGYSVIFMVVVLFIGVLLFNKVEKTFMDTV
ncbi:ABC transporter permease [Puia dinghuensis]|uniref:Transport permease protein n=1 Tax=Puia dinghuensis TaxID=1792502 RepID=A0A8J2XUS0_9BACT|nr:ABC transporter permease [Puia dinghuensis]GGB08638.1 transport permease protein [Puia dinghuensis]